MNIRAYIFDKETNEKQLVFETSISDKQLRADVRDAFCSLLDLDEDDYCKVSYYEDRYEFYFKVDSLDNTTVADRTAQAYADVYSKWLEKQHADRQAIENALKSNTKTTTVDTFKEEVNHPDRYNKKGIEVIQIMEAFMGKEAVMDFDICNVIKYVLRFKEKNGIEDLKKARWYLNNYISLYDDAESEQ